jgi:DNA polymerase-1
MPLYGGVQLVGKPDPTNVMLLDSIAMPAINEMTRVGMAIDKDWFHILSSKLELEMTELRREVLNYIPPEKMEEFLVRSGLDEEEKPEGELEDWSPVNLDSNDQLAELLYDVLDIGRGKQLKLTKGGNRISTGKKQLEQLKREHKVVRPLLEYKGHAKLKSTYTDTLPRQAVHHPRGYCPVCELTHDAETDRIHAQFPSTRTSTGRFASRHPNLQNIPSRSEIGRLIRMGFTASPGKVLVGCDFSQIEMRDGAHYSLDPNLLRIFREKLDPHTDTAMRAFNKSKEEVTTEEGKLLYRDPCKNVNFGVFYGLNAPGLLDLMGLTYATANLDLPSHINLDWCGGFITSWFDLYKQVLVYLDTQHYRCRRYGMAWDYFGRVRLIPEVYSPHERIQAAGLRQGGNIPIQSTAAGQNKIGIAMVYNELVLRLRSEGIYIWPMVTVHDELLVEVDEEYGELVKIHMEQLFSEVMRDVDTGEWMWAVSIEAKGKVMDRWAK